MSGPRPQPPPKTTVADRVCNQLMNAELSADQPVQIVVEARAHGWRVDHYLTRLFPNYSRALFQRAIEAERVAVNGLPVKPARRLRVNDVVSVQLPEEPDSGLHPEDIPLDVLYEDDALIAVNKPADMIVHPGRGNTRGTLAAALQFHFNRLSDAAGRLRPGIVHRLDRDTTGVIVVAKDNQVHHALSGQFERREVTKEYRALGRNVVERDSDYIETHLQVHPRKREKMVVCKPGGKTRKAVTFYEVLERFVGFTYLRMLPRTGRTHQLRVHLQHLGHPIVADALYGGGKSLRRSQLDSTPSPEAAEDDLLIDRQALHAYRLTFRHPASGDHMTVEAPLPPDIQRTLEALRQRL